MSILILTYSEDHEGLDVLSSRLQNLGQEVVRLNTDEFPTSVRLSVGYGDEADTLRLVPAEGGEPADLRKVTAIWNRRYFTGRQIPDDLDPQLREPSVEESRRTVTGFVAALEAEGVFALDPLRAAGHARQKPLQLALARELGLELPRTLISNDPDEARAFAGRCKQGVVTKMMTSFAVYDGDGRENVVFTNALGAEDLAALDDGLDLCPMTFQEAIPKKLEIRTTIIGHEVFSGAIDSQSSDRAQHDWRRDGAGMIEQWRPYELPADVADKLLRLHDRLGLNYGASDLILTPDGRHVFLEVNPVGEFYWLERHAGLPLMRALADVLVKPEKRRLP